MKKILYILLIFYFSILSNTFGSGQVKEISENRLIFYDEMFVGSFMLANDTEDFISFVFTGKLHVSISGYQMGNPEIEVKRVSTVIDVEFMPIRIFKNSDMPVSEIESLKVISSQKIVNDSFSGCFKAAIYLPSILFGGNGDVISVEGHDLIFIACDEEWTTDVEK